MKSLMFVMVLVFGLQLVAVADETALEPPLLPVATLDGEKGEYLIGPLTRLQWEKFETTLNEETAGYQASPDLIDALVKGSEGISVICILGTWCHDSRREVPRFWKIQDLMKSRAMEMQMIAVGRTDAMEAILWEEDNGIVPEYRTQYDVTYVPTFIIMADELEIGRIIESPEISLEADLATILGLKPSPKTH